MAQKSPLRAYEEHVEKLVKCLPMDDTLFITKLSTSKLLPGDTNSQLKALSTQAAKASYFLDHVIKPALDIDNTSSFNELLCVMECCGYIHVETLSCEIKSMMNNNDTRPGMHVELRGNVISVIVIIIHEQLQELYFLTLYTCMYVLYVCLCACLCSMCTCMYVCICVYVCACVATYMYLHLYVCACVYMCVCMHLCMYVCMYVCV